VLSLGNSKILSGTFHEECEGTIYQQNALTAGTSVAKVLVDAGRLSPENAEEWVKTTFNAD